MGVQENAKVTRAPIRILLFAGLREKVGWAERCLDAAVPDLGGDPSALGSHTMTPRCLWEKLELPGSCDAVRIAINQQFADVDTTLHPGDELAFLPPISGG
jgi:molybdopterin synthase sulfur carrier subunit